MAGPVGADEGLPLSLMLCVDVGVAVWLREGAALLEGVELLLGLRERVALRVGVELLLGLRERVVLRVPVGLVEGERLSRPERVWVGELEFEVDAETDPDPLSLGEVEELGVSAAEVDPEGEGSADPLSEGEFEAEGSSEAVAREVCVRPAEAVAVRVALVDPVEDLEAERLRDQVDMAEVVGVDEAERLVVTVPVAEAVSRRLRLVEPVVVGLRDRGAEFEFVELDVGVRLTRGDAVPVLERIAVPVEVELPEPVGVSSTVDVTVGSQEGEADAVLVLDGRWLAVSETEGIRLGVADRE